MAAGPERHCVELHFPFVPTLPTLDSVLCLIQPTLRDVLTIWALPSYHSIELGPDGAGTVGTHIKVNYTASGT